MDPLIDVDDDWELLPDQGYLEISDDAGKQIYRRSSSSPSAAAAAVLHSNYFSSPPRQFLQINIEPLSKDEVGGRVMDQDPISQVFFKKMKEAEFVDIRADSPKPPPKSEPNFQFDPEMAIGKNEKGDGSEDEDDDVWKWKLSGIGAICSLGVAAATFCIVVFTNSHNHRLQFRIYTDDDKVRPIGRSID